MIDLIVLIKNSGDTTVELVIEPYAHLYKIAPGSSVNVKLEEQPPDEPVEIEYLPTGITLHSAGFSTVTASGKVIPPQFFE
jgi:hypothetical protein